jgi:hypothetical protein
MEAELGSYNIPVCIFLKIICMSEITSKEIYKIYFAKKI